MSSSLTSWLMPLLLAAGCVALVMNIWSARKVNKSLVEDIERARADLRVAVDASADCSKQLETKSADITAKDQQLATINGQVTGLTKEKETLAAQLVELQKQLDAANAAKTAAETGKAEAEKAAADAIAAAEAAKKAAPAKEEAKKEGA